MIHEKIFLHENRNDVTLTTYVLDDSHEMLADKSRGAVLICPGGAYLGCSDREAEPVAMAFAAMGYHAFVLRYSVYTDGSSFPDFSQPILPKEHCIFPNPMLDIAKAMLYIRSKATTWLVDTDKIAICGFSAGGHNCAMYSVYWNKPLVTELFNVPAEQLRPAASILCYPVTDYLLMKSNASSDPMAQGLFKIANIAYFGTDNPDDALMEQVSPARLVNEHTPPTFLWTTYEDKLTPPIQATAMAHALAIANIPFELHVFEEGPHGLSLSTAATSGNKSMIDNNAAKWIDLCAEWLKNALRLSYLTHSLLYNGTKSRGQK